VAAYLFSEEIAVAYLFSEKNSASLFSEEK
jgi:hypothetical protein